MISNIIIAIVFILTVANLVFLWLLYRDVLKKMTEYDKQLSNLQIDTTIAEAFAEDGGSHEDLNKLANSLFEDVKSTFGLDGKTYSEFVELLKAKPVQNKKLKDSLIHFFEKIVIYSYRDVAISDSDKDQLKQEYKLIEQLIDEHKASAVTKKK